METLIIHPENKEQIQALKAFLNAFKIRFEEKKDILNTDFTDVSGKLTWKGDALAEQKKLRAEWD